MQPRQQLRTGGAINKLPGYVYIHLTDLTGIKDQYTPTQGKCALHACLLNIKKQLYRPSLSWKKSFMVFAGPNHETSSPSKDGLPRIAANLYVLANN